MTDEILYRTIGAELECGTKDSATWAQALAEADGDPERTKAAYVRLRLQALKKAAVFAAANRIAQAGALDGDSVASIRNALAAELPAGGVSNLYQVLGVTPDATDAAIQQLILDREEEIAGSGTVRSPQFNYAKETLGNPQEREQYDRKLFAQLRPPVHTATTSAPRENYVQAEGIFLPWWGSRKVTVLIGAMVVIAVGYMALDFTRERGGREVQKATLEAQREAMRAAAETERARVDNERQVKEAQISVVEKAVDRSAELQNRAISIAEREQERRRQELEYRANAGSQILELEQERQRHQIALEQERLRAQEERWQQLKADRERRYWACMNAAIDRFGGAEASARCAAYK